MRACRRRPSVVRMHDTLRGRALRPAERIAAEVAGWPDVTVHPHRFGGLEFRRGRRELGHLHGDHLADLPFPRRIRDELVAAGQAEPHHVLPDSGWISRRIRTAVDEIEVISLLRRNYERRA